MRNEIVKSACLFCNAGCGVLIHMKGGNPVKIEGDPENPANNGVLCRIGNTALEQLNNPDRLKYPLKRKGKKGAGEWERISWDEALDFTAAKLNELKEKHGAKSVAFIQGGAKGYQDSLLARFANVFGSPNTSTAAPLCFIPTLRGHLLTYGFFSVPDFEYPSSCMMLWGVNSDATCHPDSLHPRKAIEGGSKLIVIDPAETAFSKKADIWIKPRPGSDLALALAMINVIINEELFDKEFVEKWATGFNELKNHVQEYSPEKTQDITWVPASLIREAARLYAKTKPASMVSGNGVESGINNFQFARASCILRALTGNLGRPGGDITWSESPIVPKSARELHLYDLIPTEKRDERLSASEGMLPMNYYTRHQDLTRAILVNKPYPLRGIFLMGGNPVMTYADSHSVYEAFCQLEFLVASDLYMTPSVKLADIVLPVASYLEQDRIHESEFVPAVQVIQKVAQVGECRSDIEILNNLASRMGFGNYFWDSEEAFLDFLLQPSGLTFNEFRNIGLVANRKIYRFHEENGFDTPSGKVELYSSQLESWGFDPLPVYKEPSETPLSSPDVDREYPFVMTNSKVAPYIHGCGRQVRALRKSHPDPLVIVNKNTAAELDIKEGDWIFIENRKGRVKHKVKLSNEIDPRVVILEHGWWYPEKEDSENYWSESNINILTNADQPVFAEMGSATIRGLVCKLYKAGP